MTPRPNVEIQRRKEILQASVKCFSRKGYEATSVDDIAAELPFSKALIYYYFKSKREIFSALLQEITGNIYQGWETMLAAEEDPLKRLLLIADSVIDYVIGNPEIWRVEMEFWGQLGREAEVMGAFANMFSDLREHVAQIIEDGISRGQFKPVDSRALAAALVGVYDGLILQFISDPPALDWKKVSREFTRALLEGILAKPLDRQV